MECLRNAGVDVVSGIDEEECKQLITSFSYSAKTGKPWITIKRAFDNSGSPIPPRKSNEVIVEKFEFLP